MRASFASNDKAVCAFMSTWRQAKFLIFEVLAISSADAESCSMTSDEGFIFWSLLRKRRKSKNS